MADRREDRERRGWRSDWEGEDRWGQGYGWRAAPTNPYDIGYGEDMSYDRWASGGDYARDYGRGGINREYSRDYGQDFTQGDWRTGSGRDTNLENFGQRSRYERDFDEEDWENEDEPVYWTYEEWWMVPGPFTGVGPRGYQRSDGRIFEDVCERLTQHGQIDASDMDVVVENGEITLRGQVDNRRTKRMVEDIIDDIPGVVDIHNQLRVRQDNRTVSRGQPAPPLFKTTESPGQEGGASS